MSVENQDNRARSIYFR